MSWSAMDDVSDGAISMASTLSSSSSIRVELCTMLGGMAMLLKTFETLVPCDIFIFNLNFNSNLL